MLCVARPGRRRDCQLGGWLVAVVALVGEDKKKQLGYVFMWIFETAQMEHRAHRDEFRAVQTRLHLYVPSCTYQGFNRVLIRF